MFYFKLKGIPQKHVQNLKERKKEKIWPSEKLETLLESCFQGQKWNAHPSLHSLMNLLLFTFLRAVQWWEEGEVGRGWETEFCEPFSPFKCTFSRWILE